MFLPQYQRQRKCSFRAWHIDASSVAWTLIDNGNLANQIARLVAILVKKIQLTHTDESLKHTVGKKMAIGTFTHNSYSLSAQNLKKNADKNIQKRSN